MKKSGRKLDKEIAEALGHSTGSRNKRVVPARKHKPKTPHEILASRLDDLKARLADAVGDNAWLDTDIWEIDKWISVDTELSDREWLQIAQDQLLDENVRPENAGAPPPNVYEWNDVFISTYKMNIDQGMSEEEAISEARQNAYDTVKLTGDEHVVVKTDPKLYTHRSRR